MLKYLGVLVLLILVAGCTTELPKIEFGKDQCALCRMTIMDKKFGAMLVNSKGKALRFDSGECMVSYLHTEKAFEASKFYVIDYNQPEVLIEADKAFYLQGGEVNSPMGGQLAAFNTQEEAVKAQLSLQGDIILWDKLLGLNF